MLLGKCPRYTVRKRIVAVAVYGTAAVATAIWIDCVLWWSEQMPSTTEKGQLMRQLLYVALAGSGVLGIAAIVAACGLRQSTIAGLAGSSLAWVHYGPLSVALPWRDFVWLVKIHEHGDLEVAAILSLCVATVYSLFEFSRWRRYPGKR